MTNFAEQAVDLDTKINRLGSSIRQGRDESKLDLADIAVEMTRILGDLTNFDNWTTAQLTTIKNIVDRLGIPKNYRTAGFTHRLFTWSQYKPQQGLINLFLLSNVDSNRSLEEPLLSSQQNGTFTTMKISSMVSALQRPGAGIRYLDLETRTVITQDEAYALANAGVDNGQINDQDPPNGTW